MEDGGVDTSDEFELKFPELSHAELKRSRVEPSWGIPIFELKPNLQHVHD